MGVQVKRIVNPLSQTTDSLEIWQILSGSLVHTNAQPLAMFLVTQSGGVGTLHIRIHR